MADLGAWVIWWAAGGAVVVIAALLLVAIIVTANGIQREAGRALEALRVIDANTKAIWALGRTAQRFNATRDYADALEDRTARLSLPPSGEGARRREA